MLLRINKKIDPKNGTAKTTKLNTNDANVLITRDIYQGTTKTLNPFRDKVILLLNS